VSLLGLGIGLAIGLAREHGATSITRHVQSCVPAGPGILSCKTVREVISPLAIVYRSAGIGLLAGMAFAWLLNWLGTRSGKREAA
jgi:hypothetical protein